MGETVLLVATQIVGSKEFSLWLLEQLYVVVSRVRDLSQVTFVGSREIINKQFCVFRGKILNGLS